MSEAKQSDSTAELGVLPEPAGFRSRYRSEPGMIGHYPWTYADHRRRKYDRPECEYEDLFTAEQVRAAVAAERERCADLCRRVDDETRNSEYARAAGRMLANWISTGDPNDPGPNPKTIPPSDAS